MRGRCLLAWKMSAVESGESLRRAHALNEHESTKQREASCRSVRSWQGEWDGCFAGSRRCSMGSTTALSVREVRNDDVDRIRAEWQRAGVPVCVLSQRMSKRKHDTICAHRRLSLRRSFVQRRHTTRCNPRRSRCGTQSGVQPL